MGTNSRRSVKIPDSDPAGDDDLPECCHRLAELHESSQARSWHRHCDFVNAEGAMISPVNGSRARLGCRWILFRKRSDFLRANAWTRALCIRIPEVPRIVTVKDCQDCTFWEPADKRES
jgi:hypothetical protein